MTGGSLFHRAGLYRFRARGSRLWPRGWQIVKDRRQLIHKGKKP